MATSYTSLLGLALPVQGELTGTWGDTVNNAITSLLDTAVAGTTTLSTDADVTLTTSTGVANEARQAILNCTGARTALRTITAPAASKAYIVVNDTTGGFGVKIVGVGPTTGVTIATGKKALIAWNGSDFVVVSSTDVSDSGATTVGKNLVTLTNPSAVTFPQFNADNTVSTLDAASFRTAIGAGTGAGTVTSVSVASSNGFAGTSSGGATPALTLTTSISGVLKGSASALAAATAGTDFVSPTGTENMSNKTITASSFSGTTVTVSQRVVEAKTAPTISGNALTLDLSLSAVFAVSLNANITTLTLSNPPSSGSLANFVLEFTADGTARTVTWPAAVKWAGGTAPTLTSTSTKKDAFVFYTYDGGTTYIASIIGQNF